MHPQRFEHMTKRQTNKYMTIEPEGSSLEPKCTEINLRHKLNIRGSIKEIKTFQNIRLKPPTPKKQITHITTETKKRFNVITQIDKLKILERYSRNQ